MVKPEMIIIILNNEMEQKCFQARLRRIEGNPEHCDRVPFLHLIQKKERSDENPTMLHRSWTKGD